MTTFCLFGLAFFAGAALVWFLKPTLSAEAAVVLTQAKAELYAAQQRLHEAEAKLLGRKDPPGGA